MERKFIRTRSQDPTYYEWLFQRIIEQTLKESTNIHTKRDLNRYITLMLCRTLEEIEGHPYETDIYVQYKKDGAVLRHKDSELTRVFTLFNGVDGLTLNITDNRKFDQYIVLHP